MRTGRQLSTWASGAPLPNASSVPSTRSSPRSHGGEERKVDGAKTRPSGSAPEEIERCPKEEKTRPVGVTDHWSMPSTFAKVYFRYIELCPCPILLGHMKVGWGIISSPRAVSSDQANTQYATESHALLLPI